MTFRTSFLLLLLTFLLLPLHPVLAIDSQEVRLRSYLVPMPEFEKLFKDGRQFVVFPFQELERLIREKGDWLSHRQEPVKPPRHRVLFHGATYALALDTDSVKVRTVIDLELYDNEWHQIPLFSGKLGVSDFRINRTDAVLLPITGPDGMVVDSRLESDFNLQTINAPAFQSAETQAKDNMIAQQQAMQTGNIRFRGSDLATSVDGIDTSTFFLIVQGQGRCRLEVEFFCAQKLSGGIYNFSFHVPPCPRNDLTMTVPQNARLTLRGALPETQSAAAGTSVPFFFTLKPLVDVSWFPEKAEVETAAVQPPPAIHDSSEDKTTPVDAAVATAPTPLVDQEPARVMAEVDSIHSLGDGKVIAHYRVTYRIHHASISSFSLRLPADTDLVTLQGADMDFYRLADGGRTLEVLLTTPKIGRYILNLHTETRIGKTSEVSLPLLEVLDIAGVTGHCGISSHTGIEIMPQLENHLNSQLMDSAELPIWIQERSENPILYAYRYFYYPVAIGLKLVKHPTAPGMVSCIDRCQLHSMVGKGGDVFGEARLEIKNNGQSFLSFHFGDTVEILEAAVNERLVMTSVDKDGVFKLRLVNSDFGLDGTVDSFPVRFKFRHRTDPLETRGQITLRAPVFDLDVMQVDWNVYSPQNYQFYGIQTTPVMTKPDRLPFIFRLASDFIKAVVSAIYSETTMTLVGIALTTLVCWIMFFMMRGAVFSAIFATLRKGLPAFILLMIGLFFLAAISTPNFNRARGQAKKKACISNMKTIEGATELYLMEKSSRPGMQISAEELTQEGYLKTIPQCPAGGRYMIRIGNAANGGGGSTLIICSVHAGIDDTTAGLGGGSHQFSFSNMPQAGYDAVAPSTTARYRSDEYEQDSLEERSETKKFAEKSRGKRGGGVIQQRANLKGLSSIRIDLPKTTMAGYRRGFLLPAGQEPAATLSYLSLRRFQWIERLTGLLAFCFLALLLAALRPGVAGRSGYLAAGLLALAGVELISRQLEVSEAMASEAALAGVSIAFLLLGLRELLRGRYLALWKRIRPEMPDPVDDELPPAPDTYHYNPEQDPGTPIDDPDSHKDDDNISTPPSAGGNGVIATLILFIILCLPVMTSATETRNIRTWLPFQVGADTLEVHPTMAVLTIDDLDWLTARTEETTIKPASNSRPFVIRDVHYHIEAGRYRARVEGQLTVTTWQDEWLEIPLAGGILSFRDVLVNGSGAVLLTGRETDTLFNQSAFIRGLNRKVQFKAGDEFVQNSGEELLYYTVLKGPGDFTVKFSFDCPVILSDNVFALNFSNPRIAATSLELELDPSSLEIRGGRYEKYDVEIPQSVQQRLTRNDNRQIFTARLAPTRRISCFFKPMRRVEVQPETPGRVEPETPALVQRPRFVSALLGHSAAVEENQLSGRVVVEYDIRNQELGRLTIPLPPDISIVHVQAEDMDRYRVLQGEDGRHLRLDFRTAKIGRLTVHFQYESALAHDAETATVPMFHLATVNRFKGFVALESLINADVSLNERTNLVECDPSELRVMAERLGSTPLVASFAYSEPARLLLGLNRHEALAGIPLTVTRAEILSALEPGGRRVHLARYMVKNNGVQFLDISLPEGATLASSRVADRMVRSGLQGKILKVPMVRSARQGSEFQEFPVELIYFTQGKPITHYGRIELELPRVESIISQTIWRIALPEEVRAVWDETTLNVQSTGSRVPQFSKSLKAPQQSRQMRESNAMQTTLEPVASSRSTSSLPVPLELPDLPQLRIYTQETVYSSTERDALQLKLDYISTRSYHRLHLAVFLFGFGFCMVFLRYLYKRKFPVIASTLFAIILAGLQWLESWDLNVNEYGLLGLVSALLLQAAAWLLTPDAFRQNENNQ